MTQSPKRQQLHERGTYEPVYRHEVFIVPLLADRIGKMLEGYGKPRRVGSKVLDVGCGRQPLRGGVERMGYKYVSLDTQQNEDCPVHFVCGIDDVLPEGLLAAGPFDLILCTEVLEHVANWPAAFENFVKLLAPAGRIVITCPHMYPLHEEPYDFWRPTPHTFRYFGKRYGLNVIHAESAGTAWDVIGTLLGSIQPRPWKAGLFGRLRTLIVRVCCRAAWWFLKTGLVQWMAKAEPIFISNVVVYERREAVRGA